MNHVDQLRASTAQLRTAYEHTHQRLAADFEEPLAVTTIDGRYILLDALTALVQAETVLAQIDQRPEFRP